MIEFKGAYYRKGRDTPQAVLVQFDGVVLHVWQMSNPFHRLLFSDVFRLPSPIGKRKRCIKLPNGGRIETDDVNALVSLQSDTRSAGHSIEKGLPYFKIFSAGGILLLLSAAYLLYKNLAGS